MSTVLNFIEISSENCCLWETICDFSSLLDLLEQRVCYLALVGVRVTCAHACPVTPESEKTHGDPELQTLKSIRDCVQIWCLCSSRERELVECWIMNNFNNMELKVSHAWRRRWDIYCKSDSLQGSYIFHYVWSLHYAKNGFTFTLVKCSSHTKGRCECWDNAFLVLCAVVEHVLVLLLCFRRCSSFLQVSVHQTRCFIIHIATVTLNINSNSFEFIHFLIILTMLIILKC